MTWFKVDDAFWRHRKVRRLGKDRLPAAGLWVLAGDYCADNTTDGYLTRDEVAEWDPRLRYAARLVEVGLWHEADVDGEPGYRFHQWENHQPSREEVLDRRRKRQAAGRRGGIRSGQTRRSKTEATASASASTSTEAPAQADGFDAPEAKSNPVPTRPVYAPSDEGARSPRADPPHDAAQALLGEWLDRCAKRPPGRVVGQVAVQVKAMLAEGVDPDDIRRGLAAWMTKGLHPSTLPSVVNEVMNRAPPTPAARVSTTDQRTAAVQALKTQFRDHPTNQRQLSAGGEP